MSLCYLSCHLPTGMRYEIYAKDFQIKYAVSLRFDLGYDSILATSYYCLFLYAL